MFLLSKFLLINKISIINKNNIKIMTVRQDWSKSWSIYENCNSSILSSEYARISISICEFDWVFVLTEGVMYQSLNSGIIEAAQNQS